MKVKDIMKKAVTLDKDKTIKDAASLMSKKAIGSLIIIDKTKVIGIITERDVMKYLSKSNNLNEKVEKITSKKLISIEPHYSLEDAAEIMSENKIKKLPVIKKGDLLGIITATDIIANAESVDDPFFF